MRRLALLLTAGMLLLAGCSSSAAPSSKPSELLGGGGSGKYQGAGLDPAQPRPNFTLTDTSGASFAFGSKTRGHPTLLFFGYTNCPDVCPETMADVAVALRNVPAAVARKTYVVFVSTDVKRDTAPVLTQWLGHFTPGTKATFVGLRGSQAQIDAAQAASHVLVAEDDGQTHSSSVLLYGADDYARVAFLQSNNEQKAIAHDLPLVAAA